MQANITVNLEVSVLLLPPACQQLPSRAKRAKVILKLFVAVVVIKDFGLSYYVKFFLKNSVPSCDVQSRFDSDNLNGV